MDKKFMRANEQDRLVVNESFRHHFIDTVQSFRNALGVYDVSEHTDAISRIVRARMEHERYVFGVRFATQYPKQIISKVLDLFGTDAGLPGIHPNDEEIINEVFRKFEEAFDDEVVPESED